MGLEKITIRIFTNDKAMEGLTSIDTEYIGVKKELDKAYIGKNNLTYNKNMLGLISDSTMDNRLSGVCYFYVVDVVENHGQNVTKLINTAYTNIKQKMERVDDAWSIINELKQTNAEKVF